MSYNTSERAPGLGSEGPERGGRSEDAEQLQRTTSHIFAKRTWFTDSTCRKLCSAELRGCDGISVSLLGM